MVPIIIAIIVLVIMLLFFVIMLMLTKRETTTLTTIDENGKIKDEKGSIDRASETMTTSSRSSKRGTEEEKESIRKEDMFKFMEFDKVYVNTTPDEELHPGDNADYRIYSIRNQNTSIRIYIRKLVK